MGHRRNLSTPTVVYRKSKSNANHGVDRLSSSALNDVEKQWERITTKEKTEGEETTEDR